MNKLKLVNKKLISILILLLTYLIFSSNVFAEKKTYYPYPIIFVHGINSSAEKCWSGVEKHFLQNYFSNKEVTKYFPYGGDYLILVDYERQNVGDIPTIASEALKNVVGNAIKKLPDDYKKVIIVTHSMGGLVTRSFLKQYPDYHDKIAKVIFIGTPHRGSSFA
ncbi:alpha/beta hydrolase, partial [Candidatus Pacearchaeota archaeon]|nr:alpha/beta hydrolase [Candidatus Pacearchaeota archaeon]